MFLLRLHAIQINSTRGLVRKCVRVEVVCPPDSDNGTPPLTSPQASVGWPSCRNRDVWVYRNFRKRMRTRIATFVGFKLVNSVSIESEGPDQRKMYKTVNPGIVGS